MVNWLVGWLSGWPRGQLDCKFLLAGDHPGLGTQIPFVQLHQLCYHSYTWKPFPSLSHLTCTFAGESQASTDQHGDRTLAPWH